jgi:hypothetical protein
MDFFVIWNMFHKSLKTVTVTSFLSHRSVQMPVRKTAVDREDSLSAAIPYSHLPFSFDPRCEDRSFSPDILQLPVQCTDGECSLCPLRVAGSALHRNAL